jgi:hypothetical protein
MDMHTDILPAITLEEELQPVVILTVQILLRLIALTFKVGTGVAQQAGQIDHYDILAC